MKKWLVASYKNNELERLFLNLKNQKFEYYLPKINTSEPGCSSKEEIMFPGYIFVYVKQNEYMALKFTKGIKNLIQFGNFIPSINNNVINDIKEIEDLSKKNPRTIDIQIGQKVHINQGNFKGSLVEIISLPANERVNILIHILGSQRTVNIAIKELSF